MTQALRADSRSDLRPHVTISYAQTLDGRLATAGGSSQWISGDESLCHAHELRASHDAVMVGAGTVCADDPRLTVRHAPGKDPLRVVVDSALRVPLASAVLRDGAAGRTIFAVTRRAEPGRCEEVRALGATVLELPEDEAGRVDLRAAMAALREMDVRSVMVEGGAELITALLKSRLVDRMCVCVAPKILGCGIEAVGDLGISDLDSSLTLVDTSFTPCGSDLILDCRVEYPDGR